MMQKRKIEEFVGWARDRSLRLLSCHGFHPQSTTTLVSLASRLLCGYTTTSWCRDSHARSNSGCGVRRVLARPGSCPYLRARLRVYDMPKDEDFYDGYEDGCYDLVVMDEFKSHKKIQFLNAWCDGQPLPLRQKGCQSVKNDNLPLIVCSNFSIENCYHEGIGRDALVDRFNVVRMEKEFEFK